MTRLRPVDIELLPGKLVAYDAELQRKTGLSLRQVACKAAGILEDDLRTMMNEVVVAAVPVSSGLGIIGGFSYTVGSIVTHLGFRSFVTERHDVAGTAEALERGGDILMLADDERFIAITPGRHQVVDNARATARGFLAGLEAMSGGFSGASALVLGCGPVGVAGAEALLERGATVALLDTDRGRALSAFRDLISTAPDAVGVEDGGMNALSTYDLIFEATNTGGFIDSHNLTSRTLLAAPGIPCALTADALAHHGDRILHDALEIGTATMCVEAVVHWAGREEFGKAAGGFAGSSEAGRPC